MASKGVAISQIILLVLGIIVLAVVAFLLYSNFTSTSGAIDSQKCRSYATNACTACSIANGGQVLNCPANLYLHSDNEKQCVSNGFIAVSGNGWTSVKDANGVVTFNGDGSGSINCQQYVGGQAAATCIPVDPTTKLCKDGSTGNSAGCCPA